MLANNGFDDDNVWPRLVSVADDHHLVSRHDGDDWTTVADSAPFDVVADETVSPIRILSPPMSFQDDLSLPLPSSSSSSTSLSPPPFLDIDTTTSTVSKRVRHREVDANRRRRENAAIDRLRHLLHSRGDRAAILDGAAQTITDMAAVIQRMKRQQQTALDNGAQSESYVMRSKRHRANDDTESAAMTTLLSAHGEVTRGLISESLEADSVFVDIFMKATAMQIIFDCETGACVFVNDAFVSIRGGSREAIQNRKRIVPREAFVRLDNPRFIHDVASWNATAEKLSAHKTVEQPSETMLLFKQLYLNERDVIQSNLLVYDRFGKPVLLPFRAWLSKSLCKKTSTKTQQKYRTFLHIDTDKRTCIHLDCTE